MFTGKRNWSGGLPVTSVAKGAPDVGDVHVSTVLASERKRRKKRKLATAISKHYGPGPHPSGTEQDVHGRGGWAGTDDHSNPLKHYPTSSMVPVPDGVPPPPASLYGLRRTGQGIVTDEGWAWRKEVDAQIDALEASGDLDTLGKVSAYRDAVWDEMRQIENAQKSAVKRSLSLGELTRDEVLAADVYISEIGTGNQWDYPVDPWMELPEQLWHVTTAADAVMAEGRLKTRDELGMLDGLGLGGGASDTISFTESPEIAAQIKEAMLWRHRVLSDPATEIPKAVEEAKAAGWWDKFVKGEGASASEIDLLVDGKYHQRVEVKRNSLSVEDRRLLARTGQGEPSPQLVELVRSKLDELQKDNPRAYGFDLTHLKHVDGDYWEVKNNPERRAERIGNWLDGYAAYRASNGGPMDPLFFSTDDYAFSKIDPSQIQVIAAKPKPNTWGHRLGALGEIRAWTGDVIESVEVVK